MTKDEIRRERDKLQGNLDAHESGKAVLENDADNYIEGVKRRIAEYDRKLAEDWRA